MSACATSKQHYKTTEVSAQALDFDEIETEQASAIPLDDELEINDEFMQLTELLTELKESGECESGPLAMDAVSVYDGYKWSLKLELVDNKMNLTLSLCALPVDIGAFKANCTISCDEISYYRQHKDVILTVSDAHREMVKHHVTDIGDVDIFAINDEFCNHTKEIEFKCSVETLVRYDLYGGVFSAVDKPLFVCPSQSNNMLVYGYLNGIKCNVNQSVAPLSIYELIYNYYLMIINIRNSKQGEFLWKFDNNSDIKLFLNCTKGDVITSRKFEVNGCVFYLELTPNGWASLIPEGKCVVWIAISKLPQHVHEVNILFRVRCAQIGYFGQKLQALREPQNGAYSTGPNNSMSRAKFRELKHFQFKLFVEVKEMWDECKNVVNY